MDRLAELWPPFAVRVRCGDLELRAITDADIPELVDLARRGIHPVGAMPSAVPWTETPADELPAAMAAYYWRSRAGFGPDAWTLDLMVRANGVTVGVQGLATSTTPRPSQSAPRSATSRTGSSACGAGPAKWSCAVSWS